MRWPWSKRRQETNQSLSISDPAALQYFVPGGSLDLAGVVVGEGSALGLSGFFRAMALISGTLASLPLRSLRDTGDGQRQRMTSIFDEPDGPDAQTPYEWKETLLLHLLMHGRGGALKLRNAAGGLARLALVHPLSWYPCLPTVDEYRSGRLPLGGIWFDVNLNDGTRVRFDANDFWYVPGLSMDGVHGISLISAARLSLGTAIAGDKAAANMFSRGALISGLATPADDYDITDDVPEIRKQIDRAVLGHENAGGIAVINRRLTFSPWTMSAVDSQFLQSRQFQIEEIARWTGVPPHLLMQTDKQTSWGTGVEMQDRALGRTVLNTWASRVEQRASRLLPRPRFVEFDFAGLERPSPEVEIGLLIQQVQAGLLTLNEARRVRNMPPVEGGDEPRGGSAAAPETAPADPADPKETADA